MNVVPSEAVIPPPQPQTLAQLRQRFEPEIRELETLLDRSLSLMAATTLSRRSGPGPRWHTRVCACSSVLGLIVHARSARRRAERRRAGRSSSAIFIGLVLAALVVVLAQGHLLVRRDFRAGRDRRWRSCTSRTARLVRYVAPAASLALLLHWVTDQFMQRRRTADEPLPTPIVWAFAFAAIAIVSTLANFGDPAVALMGMKNYFQMWVFFLGVVFLRWDNVLRPPALEGRCS